MSISLEEIATLIGADLSSASSEVKRTQVSGVNSPKDASRTEITFISSESYLPALAGTNAVAVIMPADFAEKSSVPVLVHPQPYLAYAQMSELFAPKWGGEGVHGTAVVDESAEIGVGVTVGANTVIAAGARVGEGAKIAANVVISENVCIGDRTQIHSSVTLYQGISLGSDCIVHSGTVIGSDGFGFAPTGKGWVKIHQLGSVQIGDKVEIGANCAIDRGALGTTAISDGVKIDNLVHIAHNVEIGENTAIAGQVGIAGSSKIGKNCMFAGQAGVTGHVEIADNVTVTGQGMITKSIKDQGVYSSGTSFSEAPVWRKNVVRFQQLDTLFRRLVKLEKKIGTE